MLIIDLEMYVPLFYRNYANRIRRLGRIARQSVLPCVKIVLAPGLSDEWPRIIIMTKGMNITRRSAGHDDLAGTTIVMTQR
jgi:hypothetical protein